MSDTPTISKSDGKLPLAVKMRSWKWWVYGDIDSKPLTKPPAGTAAYVCVMCAFWLYVAGVPWWLTWINRHPPQLSKLQVLHGEVIFASRKSPHLILRTDAGEVIQMDYPSFINNFGRSTQIIHALGSDNKNVLGCHAAVWIDAPKYTLWHRTWAWQIRCDDRSAGASFSDIRHSTADLDLEFYGYGVFMVLPLAFAIWLLRFRRGFYER